MLVPYIQFLIKTVKITWPVGGSGRNLYLSAFSSKDRVLDYLSHLPASMSSQRMPNFGPCYLVSNDNGIFILFAFGT